MTYGIPLMRYRYRLSAKIHAHHKAPHAISPDAMRNRQSTILYIQDKHLKSFTPFRCNFAIGNRKYPMYSNKAPRFYPRCDAISLSVVGGMLSVRLYNTYSPDAMRYRYRRSAFQNYQHKDLKCSRCPITI